jgi:hypothetical protein
MDVWELNQKLGSLWLKASMMGCGRAVTLFIYNLAFALHLRKSTENLCKCKIKVNVKVKLSLCLTKHHAMKKHWESGCIAPRILDIGPEWR